MMAIARMQFREIIKMLGSGDDDLDFVTRSQ